MSIQDPQGPGIGIRQQFEGLDSRGLYRLSGFEIPEEGGVCFPLGSLLLTEDPHVP